MFILIIGLLVRWNFVKFVVQLPGKLIAAFVRLARKLFYVIVYGIKINGFFVLFVGMEIMSQSNIQKRV